MAAGLPSASALSSPTSTSQLRHSSSLARSFSGKSLHRRASCAPLPRQTEVSVQHGAVLQQCTSRRAVVVCVAAPSKQQQATAVSSKPEVMVDDRKQVAEEAAEPKTWRLVEVAASAPQDFNSAEVTDVKDVADGVRCITLDAEISREFVALEKAYSTPGQKVDIRLSDGTVVPVYPCSSAFSSEMNHAVLLKLRGDIPAGSTKLAQYGVSVRGPLELHVSQDSSPALYNLQPGSSVEVGPFRDGIDLRPLMFLTRYPKLLVFARGQGIAAARALIEAQDVGTLYLRMRQEVRLYYSAPTPSNLAYKEKFEAWEQANVKVLTTVDSPGEQDWDGFVGSFENLFDEDDLEYDPDTTAAVVLGSKASTDDVMKLLDNAGLPPSAIIRWDM